MSTFVGRKHELKALNEQLETQATPFIIIKGRRRIGKTRLLQEFSHQFDQAYIFSGLPPEKGTTAQSQRDEFAKQLTRQLKIEDISTEDWGDLFWLLWLHIKKGKCLIVLDEISWMGSKDPLFLGKLKNAWDLYLKQNDQLVLAISGSASAWIEKNILSSTGFMGRITLDMTLNELPLYDCLKFWKKKGAGVSPYDKFKVLSVTGGVPRYLEAIGPELTAEENIKRLCFTKDSILYKEFDHIFSDLFSSRSELYKRIVSVLVNGAAEQKTICKKLGIKPSGDIGEYLEDLVKAGFVSRDFTWHIKKGKFAKLSQYRLKDNYTRFYLKYILPNKPRIESDGMQDISLADLPQWNTILGFQFENLVLNNRNLIKRALNISASDVICDNPYFQHKTVKQQACQIDYLIQTRLNTLYICEIKFSKNEIKPNIIKEVQNKLSGIKKPLNFSYWPVLIYVNGVHNLVEEEGYFAKLINFTELMQEGV